MSESQPEKELTIQQQLTIEELLTGKTDAAAGHAVGAHRTTVTRWRLCHPVFRATLNQRRSRILEAARDRLRTLIRPALEVLGTEVEAGNWKAALAMLRGLAPQLRQLDDGASSDPQVLLDQLAVDRHRRRLERMSVPPHVRLEILHDLDQTSDIDTSDVMSHPDDWRGENGDPGRGSICRRARRRARIEDRSERGPNNAP